MIASLAARRSARSLSSGLLRTLPVRFFATELTGTVKFYLRHKTYGYIVPDDESIGDVFVKRESILSDVPPDESPFAPFLRAEERVRFEVVDQEDHDTKRAANVTFEDGSRIPLYRKNYVQAVTRGEQQRLGERILAIAETADLTDEDMLAQVKKAIAKSLSVVEAARERVGKVEQPGADTEQSGTDTEQSDSDANSSGTDTEQSDSDANSSGTDTEQSDASQSDSNAKPSEANTEQSDTKQ